jgi:hypothetical protein
MLNNIIIKIMKTEKILEKTVIISNVRHIYPELPTGNSLRISIGALSLHNQKSNAKDDCHPMICGWNENPAVGFTDFQWWLKCHIEDSNFIVGEMIIPFKEKLLLYPKTTQGELSVVLEFKDGTRIRLVARDETKPIEVCVWGKEPNFLKKKIKEYGYTDLSD